MSYRSLLLFGANSLIWMSALLSFNNICYDWMATSDTCVLWVPGPQHVAPSPFCKSLSFGCRVRFSLQTQNEVLILLNTNTLGIFRACITSTNGKSMLESAAWQRGESNFDFMNLAYRCGRLKSRAGWFLKKKQKTDGILRTFCYSMAVIDPFRKK